MNKKLTSSKIDRQNILNNRYAIEAIQEEIGFKAVVYNNEFVFSKEQIARFFEVDERTIERYIEKHSEELSKNGYKVLRGKSLNIFKLWLAEHDVTDINVGNKTPQFGMFNFRAFLNLGMLLVESEKARILRGAIFYF